MLTRLDFPGGADRDEYAVFEVSLKKALSVPHSTINAKLNAERPALKRRGKKSPDHASRDKD